MLKDATLRDLLGTGYETSDADFVAHLQEHTSRTVYFMAHFLAERQYRYVEGMEVGGPFLPVSYNHLRVQFPGNHGVNWGGTSFDPQLGYLFANVNELGQISGIRDHDRKDGPARANGQGNRLDPDGPYEGIPGGGRFSVKGAGTQQLPCQQPPWGELVAVNVNTGEIAWRTPSE